MCKFPLFTDLFVFKCALDHTLDGGILGFISRDSDGTLSYIALVGGGGGEGDTLIMSFIWEEGNLIVALVRVALIIGLCVKYWHRSMFTLVGDTLIVVLVVELSQWP